MAKVPNENLPLSAIGMFPSDWQEATLASICHQVTDGTHDSPKPVAEGGFPLVTGKAIKDRRIDFAVTYNISEEDHRQVLARSKAEEGDILFANIGNSIGDLVRVQTSRPFSIKNVALFKPNQEKVDPRYLEYYFLSEQVQTFIKGTTRGSAQPFIGLSSLRGFPVALPQMNEQIGIGSILGVLDDRIVLLRETNATLEAIAQALFKSWFVDFDPIHARARGEQPAGLAPEVAALFPDSFEESALGLVPNGWCWRTMDDVSTVGIGKTPPRKEPQWFSENLDDVPWVSIKDMGTAGVFINNTSEFLTPASIDRFNVRVVPDNTVLLSFKLTVGRLSITDGEMVTNEAIAHFKLGEDSPLSSAYIYLALRQFNFESLSSTSSIATAVNSKTVRAIPILVPSPSLVTMFNDYANPIFNRIKLLEKQAQTLANLRDTLLPRLISGQLRLPDAEQQLKDLAV
ncbi:restriction endonuclease subunit S [Aeromonas veronii]